MALSIIFTTYTRNSFKKLQGERSYNFIKKEAWGLQLY